MTPPDKDIRILNSRVDTLTGMLDNIQSEKRECLSRLDTALKERDEARATILEQDEELAILRPMELIVKDLAQGPQLGSVMYRWVDDLIRRAKAALPQKLRHDSPAKSLIKDEFKG